MELTATVVATAASLVLPGGKAGSEVTEAVVKSVMSGVADASKAMGGAADAAKALGGAADAAKAATGVTEGTTVYRVWGDGAGPNGQSWTTVDPATAGNFRAEAGLPDANTGRFVSEGRLADSTGVTTMTAAPADGNPGGLTEVKIPNPAGQIDLTNVSGANPPL